MITQLIKPGDLAYDVGAHIGVKTHQMLAAGACQVIAVEPTPGLFQVKDPRVIHIQKAVSDRNGVAKFTICGATTLSTLTQHWKTGRFASCFGRTDKVIDVETVTLDALIDEFGLPQVCKIDVEGHERSVLYGLTQVIPCLCFEFTKEFFSEAVSCVNYLAENLGYREFTYTSMVQEPERFDCPWTDAEHLLELIYFRLAEAPDFWGDIYAQS